MTDEVKQLDQFRNLRLTLDNLIGQKWLLLFMNEDGNPTYVPNKNLSAQDEVFLAELAKYITLSQAFMYSPQD